MKITLLFLLFLPFVAQLNPPPSQEEKKTEEVKKEVSVEDVVEDETIAERLIRILKATGWFQDVSVRVDEGVAFLNGEADSDEHKKWAGNLAGNTEDVVAVVNRIDVVEPFYWDLTPAKEEWRKLVSETVRSIPFLLIGLLLLFVTWIIASGAKGLSSQLLRKRIPGALLRQVIARAIAVLIFLLGFSVVLRVSGLSQLALTIIGGTGLAGLIIGFAFRDIAENFLASVLLSINRPFARSDLIEVAGHEGYVQNMNTRSTLLMRRDGNHVQIPNATIYKETIINHTANPRTRFSFKVGIGYDSSIREAQGIAMGLLEKHPAIVDDPQPLVLVDELGAATINLQIYYWINSSKYSRLKVRSSVIRQLKSAFVEAGISMPDEAREVIFPEGISVQMQEGEPSVPKKKLSASDTETTSASEGDLLTEQNEIRHQAETSREPEEGSDLLSEQPNGDG